MKKEENMRFGCRILIMLLRIRQLFLNPLYRFFSYSNEHSQHHPSETQKEEERKEDQIFESSEQRANFRIRSLNANPTLIQIQAT